MPVYFNEIPFSWLRKSNLAEIRPTYNKSGALVWPTKILVVGQMLTGIATAGVPVAISRTGDAAAQFGAGSMLDMMIRLLRQNNATSELWAVGLADAGGSVAATKTITITGTPTDAGTWPLWIAGRSVRVGVSLTDTPTTTATAIAAAINADTTLPFTATSALGVVTLTARNKGTWGNLLDVRVGYYSDDRIPPGFSAAVAAGTAGATDPTVTALLTTIANTWYTDIVWPYTDSTSMAALETDLARRYNALGGLDAHAYTCITGTYSAVTTWSSTRNSQFVSTLAINNPLDPPAGVAGALCGVAAFQLGNDPARQLGSLVLKGIKAPADTNLYLDSEQNLMLGKGLSTFDTLSDGSVVLGRVVTNYQKTSLGVADQAWLDINVPKTLSRIRYDWTSYKSLQYPRSKLAADNSPGLSQIDQNSGIVTPRTMFATYVARYRVWQQQGWVQDAEYAKANTTFEINANDKNRLDGKLALSLIGNLIVGADAIEFAA
jgi:phage tail sheath gpL-like